MVVVRRHGRCPPSRPWGASSGVMVVVRRSGRASLRGPSSGVMVVVRRSGRASLRGPSFGVMVVVRRSGRASLRGPSSGVMVVVRRSGRASLRGPSSGVMVVVRRSGRASLRGPSSGVPDVVPSLAWFDSYPKRFITIFPYAIRTETRYSTYSAFTDALFHDVVGTDCLCLVDFAIAHRRPTLSLYYGAG